MNKSIQQVVDEINKIGYHSDTEIGETYVVPTVADNFDVINGWVAENAETRYFPFVPLPHKDKEVGFDHWHVHYDFRFFTDEDIADFQKNNRGEKKEYVFKLECAVYRESLKMETRKCLRTFDKFTKSFCGYFHKYVCFPNKKDNLTKLNCGKCPHKGYQFGVSDVEDGVLTCPLHEQKFDLSSGEHLIC